MTQKTLKARQGGFTLIEILIVIGIIAVLAAIVLVAINPVRLFNKADDSQRWNDVNAILSAVGQEIVEERGVIPAAIPDESVDADDKVIADDVVDICGILVPDHMASLPRDPDAGDAYATCEDDYITGYSIERDGDNISVFVAGEVDGEIRVTR